jgi:hypothetical protein
MTTTDYAGVDGARRDEYDPTSMLRGLRELHLELTKAKVD